MVNTADFNNLEREVKRTLHEHWQVFAIQGVILVVLGTAAVALPQLASIAASTFVGWILFISGVMRGASLVRSRHAPGFWSSLLLSAVAAVLGFLLAIYPIEGALTLTIALVAYFIAHGIASISMAFSIKADTGRWAFLLLSAVVDFVLAGMVITGWPATGTWVLGLFLGINLLMTGFALIFASLGARKEIV